MKKITYIIITIIILGIIAGIIFTLTRGKDQTETKTASSNSKGYTTEKALDYVNDLETVILQLNSIITGNPIDDTTQEEAEKELSKLLKDRQSYNEYITILTDSKYENLKNSWSKYIEEVERIATNIETKNYSKNDGIITNGTLNKYFEQICEEIYSLNNQ